MGIDCTMMEKRDRNVRLQCFTDKTAISRRSLWKAGSFPDSFIDFSVAKQPTRVYSLLPVYKGMLVHEWPWDIDFQVC